MIVPAVRPRRAPSKGPLTLRAPGIALRALLPFAIALAAAPAVAQPPITRNLTFTANRNEYPPTIVSPFGAGYSACWSYIHGDGREYAIIGTNNGTAIYNVTDPYSVYRVGFITGPFSAWREMKSYRNWIYITTEGTGAGEGVQIVRMSDPEAPVLAATYTGSFTHSHTVAIDTARAILICNGTRNAAGLATGMHILSIANPEAPVELTWWPGGAIPVPNAQYVHDCVPIGNRLYCASIYSGDERVLDFTDPANPFQINAWTYPGAFTHSSWPDATGHCLYVTDEVDGQPLKIFDITNVMSPVEVNAITSNPVAIIHNPKVVGNELYLSNYTEGIRVLDLSDPVHPAEFAYADSYPGPSGDFFGVWEVCPFFPSGTVIASDMQTGLYVYRPVRDYGIVRAVVDSDGVAPLAGASVRLVTQGDSLTTTGDGIVQFAPSPGTHTVTAKKFGFVSASATRAVTIGSRDTVALSLVHRPVRDYSGTVKDAVSALPLETAEIDLLDTPLATLTDASGAFSMPVVPEDLYNVEAHAPGHIPASYTLDLDPGFPTHHIQLVPARDYDDMEIDRGWTVGGAGTGDNALTGIWVRVDPLGTSAAPSAPARARRSPDLLSAREPSGPLHEGEELGLYPGQVQPGDDRTPPPGVRCWVTGQGTDSTSISQNDVDGGKTSLTSPALDLTGMAQPTIGYWRWFYCDGAAEDWFAVLISDDDGASWVPVDTTRGNHNQWVERAISVSDFVTPTNQMKVRFIARDGTPGNIVEGAVDDLTVYDAANASVAVPAPALPRALRLATPWPNPARGAVSLRIELPRAGDARVEVLDVGGRVMRSLWRGPLAAGATPLRWDGADDLGNAAPAGLYFVRASAGGESAVARFVRVR